MKFDEGVCVHPNDRKKPDRRVAMYERIGETTAFPFGINSTAQHKVLSYRWRNVSYMYMLAISV